MLRTSLLFLLVCSLATAGFLTNTKHAFKEGDAINLKVNGLSSSKTRIPYEYYYLPLPKVGVLCGFRVTPKEAIHKASSLGELLTANHIENSVFDVNVLKNSACARFLFCVTSRQRRERNGLRREAGEAVR